MTQEDKNLDASVKVTTGSASERRGNNVNLSVGYEVIGKDGYVIQTREFPSESFVANFLSGLYNVFRAGNTANGVNTSGDTAACGISGSGAVAIDVLGVRGDATYGIVVGLGTSAINNGDFELEYQIPHNNDGLVYGNGHVKVPNELDGMHFKFTRWFLNNSSEDILVTEAGAIGKTPAGQAFLIIRDLIEPAVVIPSGGIVNIWYNVEVV